MAFTTREAEYQSYQINALNFRGDRIRYVIDEKGVRQYFYTDICKMINRSNSYVQRDLQKSGSYSTIVVCDRANHACTRAVINRNGIIIFGENTGNPTLRALAKQITDDLAAGNKSDEKPTEAIAAPKRIEFDTFKKDQTGTATNTPSEHENKSDNDTYADVLAYTFGGDEAAYTFSDTQGCTHTIVLGFHAAIHMLSVLALYIGDHEDGQGARLTKKTQQALEDGVNHLFAVTDRLPKGDD